MQTKDQGTIYYLFQSHCLMFLAIQIIPFEKYAINSLELWRILKIGKTREKK